jgi:NADH-quinone oxidoreductase subunit J
MTHVSTGEQFAFWILGSIAVIGALGMVFARNAVHSALWLVLTMLCLGFLYVVNAAPFLGAVQIIVYTGAIMMLFLFVLMLVGRDASDSLIETLRGQRVAAIILGVGFAILIATGLARSLGHEAWTGLDQANAAHGGNVQGLAALLFTKYVFAFEITSALLITAAIGAMVLAHVERAQGEIANQVSRMTERFRPGNYPGAKPGPGVYANTMSVAAPAKLPDGNGSERSISPILPVRELTAREAAPKGTEK